MKIATIIFVYNRPEHTKKVLDGLSQNTQLPEMLYIFHDGLKKEQDLEAWERVHNIIYNVSFCDNAVIESKNNKGLAESIIDGINYVLKEYDAVIVLEDDCVPQPGFMCYMLGALERYRDENEVYCINASDEPVEVPANGYDAYFMGRINSWGWATWKNRWAFFEKDYRHLVNIKRDIDLFEWFKIWGEDLEGTLRGNISGATDSWAVFWALSVMKHKGLCLAPYKSFIKNIGFDGTGIHCGDKKIYTEDLYEENGMEFNYPTEIQVVDNYEEIFAYYWPWVDPIVREKYNHAILNKLLDIKEQGRSIRDWFSVNDIKSIYIWGLGDIGRHLIYEIKDYINIKSIVMTKTDEDSYAGIPITSYKNMKAGTDAIIVVPGYDMKHISCLVHDDIKSKLVPINVVLEQTKEVM